MTARSEHLAWAKERAMSLADQRRLDSALASLVSDLRKCDLTAAVLQPVVLAEGYKAALTDDVLGMKRWIEGVT
jgi:hypothetical protein